MDTDRFGPAIEEARNRLTLLEEELQSPTLASDRKGFASKRKEYARTRELVDVFDKRDQAIRRLGEAARVSGDMSEDAELRELAQEEILELKTQMQAMEDEARRLLIPAPEEDERSVVLEIRAGTGGEEASLFAGELFRMYQRYAESRSWKTSLVSSHPTGSGGFKEIIATLEGEGAFGRLQFECGVHRVQRVPVTESGGRIHTSAVTVAVLPEAEEVDVAINSEDVRVDRFRSTGPGGQSVNTTDSAIRLTHIPTGEVVSCQDEKSQHKNLAKAMKVLRSRLFQRERERMHQERAQQRKQMIGTGDRSEKIRTYNFPQNRVTDHRVGFTVYSLDRFMEGEIGEMVEKLIQAEELRRLHEVVDHSGSPEA